MFQHTPKQLEALKLIKEHKYTLLEGGSRSGKTLIALRYVFLRALKFKNTDHLIVRKQRKDVKESIAYQGIQQLFTLSGTNYGTTFNAADLIYHFENGSRVWLAGIDDKERLDNILSKEFATIYENEANQLSFDAHETLKTRLNSPHLTGKMIIDYNPPSVHHWGYKIFHEQIMPSGEAVKNLENYAKIRMNPVDNPNLAASFLENLLELSGAKLRRFYYGDYTLENGSLWKREQIKYKELPKNAPARIVIAVDPAGGSKNGSSDTDEIGIVAVAKYGTLYWVIADRTCKGTPAHWAAEVAALYNELQASAVVVERNYGGDMCKAVIRQFLPVGRIIEVVASKSKILRAEPVYSLYEQGLVWHKEPFTDLEMEMCSYTPEADKSPNRMDALVFGLTELSNCSAWWAMED
jgi:PBSX family phage terminase large subunit